MKLEIASTIRSRLVGLLGRSEFDGVLLLVPCNDVHTFGMKRALDIAFVSAEGRIIEAHRNVKPNRRLKNRHAKATLERFSNEDPWCEPGDAINRVLTDDSTLNHR